VRWNLALAGLAVTWGLISLIAVDVHLSSLVLVFDRVALAAVAIGLGAVVAGRSDLLRLGEERVRLLFASVALAVHWVTFFGAIKLSSIAVGNLTTYTAPILLAVVAPIVLPEGRSKVAAAAIVPAAAGLTLIALAGGSAHATASGIAVGLFSAVSLAAVIILTKQLSGLHPLTLLFWSYVVIAVVTAPALPFGGRIVPHGREVPWMLVLGLAFTAGSGVLYYLIMRHVTAQAAGALMYLEPVSAAFLGWLVLGQELGWRVLVGGALVLAGGLLVVVFEPADETTASALRGGG
jgi:drug/metabolite transporter (DMT)-like permease